VNSVDSSVSRSDVYRGIRDAKGERTDLGTISSPGRTPRERFSEVIRHKIEANHHLSADKIAYSLRIATSTVCGHLRYMLGMKCCHLRWIPGMLTRLKKWPGKRLQKPCWTASQVVQPQTFIFIFFVLGANHGFYMPITSKPSGHSVLKMLIKVNDPHTSPYIQRQLYRQLCMEGQGVPPTGEHLGQRIELDSGSSNAMEMGPDDAEWLRRNTQELSGESTRSDFVRNYRLCPDS
jgi:hypothetical protein